MSSHISAPSNSRNYHNRKSVINTTPDSLKDDVIGLITAYTDDVVDAIFDKTLSISKNGATELKSIKQPPPSSIGTAKPMKRRVWNEYSKGWSVKTKGGKANDSYVHCIVYNNSEHYRLTHLLELGHYTRKKETYTRAFKHIEPINDECVKQLEEDIPKIIKKGGKL